MITNDPPAPENGKTWLEDALARMEGLYAKFGRDGFKGQPLADVQLLLSAKQLQLDAAKGRNLNDAQEHRLLTLAVRDIAGYISGQLAGQQPRLGMSQFRGYQQQGHQRQQYRPKGKDVEMER